MQKGFDANLMIYFSLDRFGTGLFIALLMRTNILHFVLKCN